MSKIQKIVKFLLLLFCFNIFSSIAQTNEDIPLNNLVINEVPKGISPLLFEDFLGNEITLKNYMGKLVVINFWATYCAPCIEEFPMIVDLSNEYKDQGLKVYFVSADWSASGVSDFLNSTAFRSNSLSIDLKTYPSRVSKNKKPLLSFDD